MPLGAQMTITGLFGFYKRRRPIDTIVNMIVMVVIVVLLSYIYLNNLSIGYYTQMNECRNIH